MSKGAKLFVLLLWALVASGSVGGGLGTAAWAQSAVIREIVVDGNRRVEPETVKSYLTFNVGDVYDAGKADESVQNLFQTGLFSDVRIDRQGGTVIVHLSENPVINKIAFEGNHEIEDKTLEGEIQLKARSVLTRARVQADVQRLLDLYQKQGLFAVTIEPKVIDLEQNRVNLVYEISEGPSTKVQSVNFIGNRAFTDAQLKDVITTTEKNLFSWLKNTDIYDPDRLNLDRELLRQFYIKHGYADAQVISATADLDRSGQGFFITFTVEEGAFYTFGEISAQSSLAGVDAQALLSSATTVAGETYDASKVEKSVEQMTLDLAEQGYAFAQVRPRAQRDEVAHTIGVLYSVEDGPHVYIERIDVVGNLRTSDHVIRREFRLAEGDAFNKLLVSRAKQRLQGLGFFKSVDVNVEQGSAGDRVVLTVSVLEESTGELSFGGGYSTSEGVIADISYKERNLMGNGQYLSVSLSGSLQRQQIDLSFTEPRFLDTNLSAGFDLYHKELDYRSESGYRSRKTGGALRLGIPLSDNLALSTRYLLSREEIYSVTDEASFFVKQSQGEFYTSALGYSLSYDTRNVKSNPTRGIYLELAQDFAGLGGDVYYIRSVAEARGYVPLTDKITLVGRLIGGNISGWGGHDVRLSDLFFKGGETIRGFNRSGYGPRDQITGDGLGGEMFYAATAEVRFPLPLVPEDLGLGGAIFADAGSLFDANDLANSLNESGQISLVDESSLRSSVGASLLWNSPMGPLRADYAYVLSAEEYDRKQMFRFGASTKF